MFDHAEEKELVDKLELTETELAAIYAKNIKNYCVYRSNCLQYSYGDNTKEKAEKNKKQRWVYVLCSLLWWYLQL